MLCEAMSPELEDRLMIDPGWFLRRYGSAYLAPRKTPSRLTSWVRRQSEKDSSSIEPEPLIPALLTRTLSPSIWAFARSNTSIHPASCLTSRWAANAVPSPNSVLIAAATLCAPDRFESASVTRAPCCASKRAHAAPSPCAPPVMNTFLPSVRRPAGALLPNWTLPLMRETSGITPPEQADQEQELAEAQQLQAGPRLRRAKLSFDRHAAEQTAFDRQTVSRRLHPCDGHQLSAIRIVEFHRATTLPKSMSRSCMIRIAVARPAPVNPAPGCMNGPT